ncbi:MAG: CRISPR-associated ring nuclease [Thermodesulfobacteriota bacterium]
MSQQVLIATLGTEPQVVTLALDLLEAKGHAVAEVIVLHTAGQAVRPALARLREEFAGGGTRKFRAVPVEGESGPVADIVTDEDMAALLRTMYRTVITEKRAGRVVHLSIAGGRKPMAVSGMVVAQLLFDEDDRVWHLLTENWRPGDERVLHIRPGDRSSLVPVPVLRWSSVSPVLTELALREDPWEAIQAQRGMKQEEDLRRKREFLDHWLTPAERQVVRLACQGLDNAAIARHFHKSYKTVANQFTNIYDKLREWRGFRDDIPVSRTALVAEFLQSFMSLPPNSGGFHHSLAPGGRGQEPAPCLTRG